MSATDEEMFRICQMGRDFDGPRVIGWSLRTNEVYLPVPNEVAQWAKDDGETVIYNKAVLALTGGEQMVRASWLSEGTQPEQEAELKRIVNSIQNRIEAEKS